MSSVICPTVWHAANVIHPSWVDSLHLGKISSRILLAGRGKIWRSCQKCLCWTLKFLVLWVPQINLSSYFSHMPHLSLQLTSSLTRLKRQNHRNLWDNRGSIILKQELQQKAYKEVRLEFPGGTVFRTCRFHYQSPGSIPRWKTKILQAILFSR